MYKRFVGAMYVLNIVMQSIFTLLTPAALGFFIAWLAISKLSAPQWLYAVLIPVGVISGFISMVKFAISASEGLERMENGNSDKNNKKHS